MTQSILRVRELLSSEFPAADEIWRDYHETKGDPLIDRIFVGELEGRIVSLARCRRHPDGLEVDGIFTPEEFRNKGYAKTVVSALVEACHNSDLHMYAVTHLTRFYSMFGFDPVPEKKLPSTIRERYRWAAGNMEGANVQPMIRKRGLYRRSP